MAHTFGPFNCNNELSFDSTALQPIMELLRIEWTVIHRNAAEFYFWDHEWSKHGTCALQLEPLNSQLKFFSQGNKFSLNKTEKGLW